MVSILTLIALFFFIVQTSYDNLMKPINSVRQSSLIKPIDPNLDLSTLKAIENRKNFTPWLKKKESPLLSVSSFS